MVNVTLMMIIISSPICTLPLSRFFLIITVIIGQFRLSNQFRWKRDFMYVSEVNSTDATCFQDCNDEWKSVFEHEFNLSTTDFYDFPLHPAVLDHAGFVTYCNISEQRTQCYINECNDQASFYFLYEIQECPNFRFNFEVLESCVYEKFQTAVRVFSPSNFLCRFKKHHFLEARSCLEKTEPLTFLKCDQTCHLEALKNIENRERAFLGKASILNKILQWPTSLGRRAVRWMVNVTLMMIIISSPICTLPLSRFFLIITVIIGQFRLSNQFRWKRDFMYVSEVNSTDATCFQ
ncbi:hypothetical protein WUBG_13896, partial [Wuchereria bancrofti]